MYKNTLVSGFVRPISMATPQVPVPQVPANGPAVPLPVPPEYQQQIANEVGRFAQAQQSAQDAAQAAQAAAQQAAQASQAVLAAQNQMANAANLSTLPPELRSIIEREVAKQLQLEKAKHFNDAPLFTGTWKRVIQLVGLGIAAVVLWEGGKWVVEQIWPSGRPTRPTAART